MRLIFRFFILITLISSTTARAQDSKNAATWYRKAIDAYQALPRDLRDSIFEWDWSDPNKPVTDQMRLALAKMQPVLRLTMRGAKQQHSDFELAYEEGFDLLLPHLGAMRGITKMAMADAVIKMRDGDSANAAAELASIYRMSGHLNSDQILISSLVGNAIFSLSDSVAQFGFDNATFNAEDSAIMMEALNTFSDEDPFNYIEAIIMEREVMTEWLTNKYADQEDGGELLAKDLTWLTPNGQVREDLAKVTQDEFSESLDQVDTLVNRVVEAFMDPDEQAGRAALDKIGKEIENGEHGVLASVLIPAYGKIFDRMHIAEQQLATRKAALALLITGNVTPEQGANAVVWYMRAIALLPEIEQEKRDQWKVFAIESDKLFDEDITKSLTEAQSIISIVREASQKKRCDFVYIYSSNQPAIPVYLPGFRELANLLIADTNRLFELGEADEAFDRLDICLRMSAHLSKDKVITSALLSHKIFTLASAVLQKPITLAFLDDVHRVLLEDAFSLMGRKDPFGYIAAVTATRKNMVDWFWFNTQGAIAKDEALRESIRNCQIDRLLSLKALMRREYFPESKEWPEAPTDTLEPLSDIITLEVLSEIELHVPALREALKAKQYKTVLEKELPILCTVRKQLARARADFRQAVLALKD